MLKSGLKETASLISKHLSEILEGTPKELYGLMRDYPLRGGKHIRPFLCLQAAEVLGGKAEDALSFALAAELLHNFSLVHDDIEDKSETRRGEPCLHLLHGDALAINAGDGLFALAFQVLHSAELPAEKVCEASALLADTATEMCEGQSLDIAWQNEKHIPSEKEYFGMVYEKTGTLLAASLELGAIAAGGNEKDREILHDFGSSLGIAFQIQDDILDLVGDESVVGKTLGNDIIDGKRTLIAIHAMEKAKPSDSKRIRQILDAPRNTKSEIKECIELFSKYNAIDYARNVARGLVRESKKRIDSLPPSDAKKTFLELADYVINREL